MSCNWLISPSLLNATGFDNLISFWQVIQIANVANIPVTLIHEIQDPNDLRPACSDNLSPRLVRGRDHPPVTITDLPTPLKNCFMIALRFASAAQLTFSLNVDYVVARGAPCPPSHSPAGCIINDCTSQMYSFAKHRKAHAALDGLPAGMIPRGAWSFNGATSSLMER